MTKNLRLLTETRQEFTPKVVATFDDYALFSFSVPMISEAFWFEYTSSRREKCLTSYKLQGKDFCEPATFLLDFVFLPKPDPDIVKMGIVEELCTLALMIPNDKEFILLLGFLEGKRDFKMRFSTSVKNFSENKDMDTTQKAYANRKGMFYLYYVLAIIYNEQFPPDADPVPRENYIEHLFW